MKIALNIVGVICAFFGTVWILQGISVLPGSFMSGDMKWAYIGAGLVVLAILLLIKANRKKSPVA